MHNHICLLASKDTHSILNLFDARKTSVFNRIQRKFASYNNEGILNIQKDEKLPLHSFEFQNKKYVLLGTAHRTETSSQHVTQVSFDLFKKSI